jgi:hypothetical protein
MVASSSRRACATPSTREAPTRERLTPGG